MLLSIVAGQEKIKDKPELLPSRNCLHFVDRVTYHRELHHFFGSRVQGPQRFVLRGLGGIG